MSNRKPTLHKEKITKPGYLALLAVVSSRLAKYSHQVYTLDQFHRRRRDLRQALPSQTRWHQM